MEDVNSRTTRGALDTTAIGSLNMADLLLSRGAARFHSEQVKLEEIYVCSKHEEELATNAPWVHGKRESIKEITNRRGKQMESWRIGFYCTLAPGIDDINHGLDDTFAPARLSKDGSAALLKYFHSLPFYPMGTPICAGHKLAVDLLVGRLRRGETPSTVTNSQKQSLSQPDDIDEEEEAEAAAEAMKSRLRKGELIRTLAKDLGHHIHITMDYSSIQLINKKRKARNFLNFVKEQCAVINGKENEEESMEMAMNGYCSAPGHSATARTSPTLDKMLKNVANMWYKASSPMEKRRALSLVAWEVTYNTLLDYIPNLSHYYFTEGRKYAKGLTPGGMFRPRKITRRRWTPLKVECFVDWIVSSGGFVADLPFGHVTARKDDGTKVELPALLRLLDASRIIITYEKHLTENNHEELRLSHSTYRAILKRCKALQRHSVKGLDYYTKEALDSFDDLANMFHIMKGAAGGDLNPLGDRDTSDEFYKNFQMAKNYLRVNYKLHLKTASHVPDHCLTYALSDQDTEEYRETCDHDHEMRCEDCERVKTTMKDFEEFLPNIEDDDLRMKQEAIYMEARTSLQRYKAHQLRTVNQDRARADILKELDFDEAFVILDWAMKHLPLKARETQADWYGKRGVSWMIAVVIMKFKPSKVEQENPRNTINYKYMERVYVYVIPQSSQKGSDVAAIVDSLVWQLKDDWPREDTLRNVYFRSDKAACFHNSHLFRTLQDISKRHGINIKRWDFSEPQSGKSSCDRHAARIKQNIRRAVDANIANCAAAEEFVRCITMSDFPELNGALKGVITTLGDVEPVDEEGNVLQVAERNPSKYTIPRVCKLNNFLFNDSSGKIFARNAQSHEI